LRVQVFGEQAISGFLKPVPVFKLERPRVAAAQDGTAVGERLAVAGPLTEREREVVGLIVRGCTKPRDRGKLVIAEGTAVRHVANILTS